MYWPSKQAKSEVHGPLMVTYLDEEAFAHYSVRRFEVKPVDHCSHYSQVFMFSVLISVLNNFVIMFISFFYKINLYMIPLLFEKTKTLIRG